MRADVYYDGFLLLRSRVSSVERPAMATISRESEVVSRSWAKEGHVCST